VTTLYLITVGTAPPSVLDWIDAAAVEWFPFPVRRLPSIRIPEKAYDPVRAQHNSVEILKALARAAPRDTARILGITEADLAIPMLTFLFGQALFNGPIALVSLYRLRQEFYGLPADDALLRERATKETLHELGHTFGLSHCTDASCPMSLSTDITLVDAKTGRYCRRCGGWLADRFASLNGDRL
jgi:archaemetzincin